MNLDDAVVEAYVEVDVPADRITIDGALSNQFAEVVKSKLGFEVDRTRLLKRLLTLRKTGQLPRLRR